MGHNGTVKALFVFDKAFAHVQANSPPVQLTTQADSPRRNEWPVNPASSQQKSYHWIAL